jgi:amidase
MVRNPYSLDRSACGSSSGSAAAVAAGYVAAAIGTETDGSITCPAAANGLVGFKPTVGLVSRTLVVPISAEQDTAGPIARTVRDAAAVLTAISGSDPADPATGEADARKTDFVAGLDRYALKGARIGVLRGTAGGSPQTEAVFEQALAALRDSGAILVEVKPLAREQRMQISAGEDFALNAEFKAQVEAYLAATPARQKVRALDQLIAFNKATPAETALFGQEVFEEAAKSPPLTDAKYKDQRATARRIATEGLETMLREANVEVVVAASGPPVFMIDAANGDSFGGGTSALPAVAGAPHLTVPMGQVSGLPVGISFIGPRWSDGRVLALGYAFEQATHAWREPRFLPAVQAQPAIGRAFDPHAPAATHR